MRARKVTGATEPCGCPISRAKGHRGNFCRDEALGATSVQEIMMRLPFVLLPLLALLALTACETVQGAGRDLQTAGAVVTDEAQDAQSGM
jgi:predicted small secreted protein